MGTAGTALVVMAAGSGTRYGGLKQVEPIGPCGEAIVEYSIFDALHAGFDEVVFVIRRDIESVFRASVGARVEECASVSYVFQDEAFVSHPSPKAREKPWGTGQAVLCAAEYVTDRFAVINADDFYGRESFGLLASHLHSGDQAGMVGFQVRNTLSEFGPVKRGLCTVEGGYLCKVTEVREVHCSGGQISCADPHDDVVPLTGLEIVSMNMWAFDSAFLSYLEYAWKSFIGQFGKSATAEFYIPDVVTAAIDANETRCRVLETPSDWFGVTYRGDRRHVISSISELIESGTYPEKLWL